MITQNKIIEAPSEIIKFIRLKCAKCGIEISKNFTPKETIKHIEKDAYYTKLISLKSVYIAKKTKLKNCGMYSYLYENVKCVSCESKIGKFIKSATTNTLNLIDQVLFTTQHLSM
jgi:hypothetical protein